MAILTGARVVVEEPSRSHSVEEMRFDRYGGHRLTEVEIRAWGVYPDIGRAR
jgi:hypothetical protein